MDPDIRYAVETVAGDPMGRFLGIEVESVERGRARLSMPVRPEYTNSLGRAHGMAISCIVDQAVAVASNATEYRSLVVELKINFLDGVPEGDRLVAEAAPVDLRRKLGLWEVTVTDAGGRRVAAAQALTYHRPRERG